VKRHAAAFLLWFVVLWWLWQLLVGEWSHYEWIFAAGAALVAAAIGELAVTRTSGRAPLPLAIVTAAPSALGMVFVDFFIVMAALLRRREGVLREVEFRHPDDEPHRTWAAIAGNWSPNAYVIDIGDGRSLTHHMVPKDASQRPA
jgi:hypothetical protein